MKHLQYPVSLVIFPFGFQVFDFLRILLTKGSCDAQYELCQENGPQPDPLIDAVLPLVC